MVDSWTATVWRAIGNLPKNIPIWTRFQGNKEPKSSAGGAERVEAMHKDSPGPGTMDSQAIELDILDKKIRRLVCKLKKYDINLEVFDHSDIVSYGRMLGKGGEGVVQQCTVLYNGLHVDAAIKTMLDNSDDAISITLDEIELLCLAKDPIINPSLQVYGVVSLPDKKDPDLARLAIITEAGIMNALQLYQEEAVPLHVTLDLWGQLAAAVHCMHTKKIIHQDLKPENILVTRILRDKSGAIEKIKFKIIDMGMAKRVFTEKIVTDDILGTVGYHAPEVLFEDSYDFRADIFMLGITFCVTLHPPHTLKKTSLQAWLKKIHKSKENNVLGKDLYKAVIETNISENVELPSTIKNMICQMLEKQTRRKITLLEIFQLCQEESGKLLSQQETQSPALGPCLHCQDSGVSSGEHSSQRSQRGIHRRRLRRSTQAPTPPRRSSRRNSEASEVDSNFGVASSHSSVHSVWKPSCAVNSAVYSPRKTRSATVDLPDLDLELPDVRRRRVAPRVCKKSTSSASSASGRSTMSSGVDREDISGPAKRTRSVSSLLDAKEKTGKRRRRS